MYNDFELCIWTQRNNQVILEKGEQIIGDMIVFTPSLICNKLSHTLSIKTCIYQNLISLFFSNILMRSGGPLYKLNLQSLFFISYKTLKYWKYLYNFLVTMIIFVYVNYVRLYKFYYQYLCFIIALFCFIAQILLIFSCCFIILLLWNAIRVCWHKMYQFYFLKYKNKFHRHISSYSN